MTTATDYGPLSDVVTYGGYVVGAAGAVLLAFRGRARWEPSEEDISRGPQRVGVLLVGLGIVLLWTTYHDDRSSHELRGLAVALSLLTLLFLLGYTYLVSTMTYEKWGAIDGRPVSQRVIGGYRLTAQARDLHEKQGVSIKEVFKGAAYDVDLVWTGPSRAFAKMSFTVAYLGLSVAGAVALAAIAILLSGTVDR